MKTNQSYRQLRDANLADFIKETLIKRHFSKFDNPKFEYRSGAVSGSNKDLDALLCLNAEKSDRSFDGTKFAQAHPNEEFYCRGMGKNYKRKINAYDIRWTDYLIIKRVLNTLNLTENDVFYDLGSGLGRMIISAAIITPAVCKGIEFIPERIEQAIKAKQRLALDNLHLICGNVLDQDFSDGTAFYMWEPFSNDTQMKVIKELEKISKNKQITIAAKGCTRYFFGMFEKQSWLKIKHNWGDWQCKNGQAVEFYTSI